MSDERKGEWAEVADEGIAPVREDDHPVTGETTGDDTPATSEGIDLTAGDAADAVTDGGAERPEGVEPDLKDAGAPPRQVDLG